MSLNTILNTANSGIMASQIGLRTVADNIANLNTAGYTRKQVAQSGAISRGMGVGVDVEGVRRVTDKFLQTASLDAASNYGRTDVIARVLDSAQSLFGDPSDKTSFFSRLDGIYAAFSRATSDPAPTSSSLLRGAAVDAMQDFFAEAGRIHGAMAELAKNADAQLGADVDRVNSLLEQIDSLNVDIASARIQGGDSTGSENLQSQMIDELSTLMNVRLTPRELGGVVVRSPEGFVLAGQGRAVLSYNRDLSGDGYITAESVGFTGTLSRIRIDSGEIKGLLDLRNVELNQIGEQLGEMVSRTAEELNRAANASSAVPAPTTLTGRNTGLDLPTALNNFTGKTTLAVMSADGVAQRRIEIDFDAMTMTADPPNAAVNFTRWDFIDQLNTTLGGMGTASFADGALSISATGTDGIAFTDTAASPPSDKIGKTFSHFFGMNDIVRSVDMASYETGLTLGDEHGFTPGDEIVFRVTDGDGVHIRDVVVQVPPGGTVQELIDALNASPGALGGNGRFELNAYGEMSFKPHNAGTQISVLKDDTSRGPGGPSVSGLFGLGMAERATRASAFSVERALVDRPSRLPFAQLDLTAPVSLTIGDGKGALALAKSGERMTRFSAAGGTPGMTTTVNSFSAELSGSVGRRAAVAESRRDSHFAIKGEADTRRQAVEGVNLEEELVSMTTYQQAFNASARMVQATRDLFDVLLGMV